VVDDNVGGDANAFDVIFLFEDVNSGTALANVTNLTTTTNGVITSENALYDNILGANTGGNSNTPFVNIINNTHPITNGLPLGSYDIGDAAFHANNLASGTVLAEHPNGQVAIAIWETGDAMDVGIAPGRRTIVPHTNNSGGFNTAGEDLLVQAIIWTAGVDSDLDGVTDNLDLDSDNDGIYDVVEAGHDVSHTAGRLTGPIGLDGVPNIVQGSGQEDSATINYTVLDSDSDGNRDYIALDSDADGCEDVVEAGYTENVSSTGELAGTGTNSLTGLVTGNGDGYTVPADGNFNTVFDYREAGAAPVITIEPLNIAVCPGCDGSFTVLSSNTDSYQWQQFNGSTWVDLTDSGIHSGTMTATLNITNASRSDNGNQYRVIASNSAFICSNDISNEVILTVNVSTVITNRRITYRVKKN